MLFISLAYFCLFPIILLCGFLTCVITFILWVTYVYKQTVNRIPINEKCKALLTG